MIKLKEPGERGGCLTVEMTPFDALSLLEGLTAAIFVLEDKVKENEGQKFFQEMYAAKLKDARDNHQEITKVLEDRENALKESVAR